MKKSLLILLALSLATIGAGCAKSNESANNNQNQIFSNYTASEVSTHNSETDCWVMVNDGVYNLTTFIDKHPGGPEKIIGVCGTEVSSIFTTVHENVPWDLLGTFKVGELSATDTTAEIYYTNSSADDIIVESLSAGDEISSPLTIKGRVRGTWLFEATAPVVIVDWDGLIIGEGYISTTDDWMTENFVEFEGTITFTSPTYKNNGAIILQNANPSDLPENDKSLEIPILFTSK